MLHGGAATKEAGDALAAAPRTLTIDLTRGDGELLRAEEEASKLCAQTASFAPLQHNAAPTDFSAQCVVCVDALGASSTTQVVAVLPCGHAYCDVCWEQWRNVGGHTCPVCRQVVKELHVLAVRIGSYILRLPHDPAHRESVLHVAACAPACHKLRALRHTQDKAAPVVNA